MRRCKCVLTECQSCLSRNASLLPGVAAFQGRPAAAHWIPRGRQRGIIPRCISKVTTERADYASSASDSNVLRLPIKQELTPKDVIDVFDYARNLRQKCALYPTVHSFVAKRGNGRPASRGAALFWYVWESLARCHTVSASQSCQKHAALPLAGLPF